ncbi:hypothetical protein CCACVL1_06398 [Corchorus capsularis]|uniref:Terpene synthase metal-binding domain-containing protein n=1 Tax=Corchorus capsularis TaxID=210143 RepID=A0A1R3JFS4_COCAP|nr:hypothetical protein CCACVL1_06398 [Corchorus capsularis]
MAAQVEESLKMPLHWRLIWTEARNFIDIYQRDDKMNSVLLEFAKLNYNILQSVYIKELQELAKWDDPEAIEELPEYIKLIYTALYNHAGELADDTLDDKSINILPFIRKLYEGHIEAGLQEVKWIYSGYNPSADEYLQVSGKSIGGPVAVSYAVVGVVGQYSMYKFLSEFIDHYLVSDLVSAPGYIARLLNDLSTTKDEIERGQTLNFINCYMMEEGVSEEEARDHMEGLKRKFWKKLNKYIIEYSVDAPNIAKVVINMVRVTHHIYRGGKYDWFGVRPKADLLSMLNSVFEPIPM